MWRGGYITGIGTAGLISDFKFLGLTDETERREMMLEAIGAIHVILSAGPGYDIDGKYQPVRACASDLAHLGIGQICRPYEQPFRTACLSIVSPHSSSATCTAERGWEIVPANLIQSRYIQSYWKVNTEGCENVERHPNSKVWRIARSIRV